MAYGHSTTSRFGQDMLQVSARAKDHFAHLCIFNGKGVFQALYKGEQVSESPTQIAHGAEVQASKR